MKKSGRCPKCQSTRVGYVPEVADHTQGVQTRHLTGNMGFFKAHMQGPVEAYVCTECGFFEEYVKAPTEVSWDEVRGFRYVRDTPPEEGPYRSE